MPEELEDVVSIQSDETPPDKGASPDVTDVDDLVDKPGDKSDDEPDKKEASQDSPPPADKGDKSVEDQLKELQDWKTSQSANLTKLETDKKNLQIALHKERQAKKEASSKPDDTPLTDEQLKKILEENPDPETQLKVARYVAQQAAKETKVSALSEVEENNRAKVANDFLMSRYPTLADENSDLRADVDQTKERFGLTNNKLGDLLAVGIRVTEDLPKIIKDAYERGKKEAIAGKANENREKGIKNSDLTPKGKGSGKASEASLSQTQAETAHQMDLSPSQRKIMKSLVGKTARNIVVED